MPERAARRNTVIYAVGAGAVAVVGILFAVFWLKASADTRRIRTELRQAIATVREASDRNRAAILADCKRTNKARAQSNAQIRQPLKEMIGYFVQLVNDKLKQQAGSGKPLPDLLRTLDFKERFEMFYRQVKLQPQLDCKRLAGAP